MDNMEKEFVPFELAVKLKELSFTSHSYFGGWDSDIKWHWHPDSDIMLDAPLWQQAFDWFETKGYYFGLYSDPENNLWSFDIWQLVNEKDPMQFWFESGYLYRRSDIKSPILKKLIEIITKKQ